MTMWNMSGLWQSKSTEVFKRIPGTSRAEVQGIKVATYKGIIINCISGLCVQKMQSSVLSYLISEGFTTFWNQEVHLGT